MKKKKRRGGGRDHLSLAFGSDLECEEGKRYLLRYIDSETVTDPLTSVNFQILNKCDLSRNPFDSSRFFVTCLWR